MRKNTIKVSREQLGILQHLDKASVRYIAVGDFAMLAIDPARMLQQAKLWIDPAKQNLQRFNEALKSMFGPRTTRQVNLDAASDTIKVGRQFSLGVGSFRVGIHFGIGGFKPGDFQSVYDRGQTEKVAVPGQQGGGSTIKRLNNMDLSHQLRTEGASHVGWNLSTIKSFDNHVVGEEKAQVYSSEEHKGQFVPYALRPNNEAVLSLSKSDTKQRVIDSKDHKGQIVPYGPTEATTPLPPIRDIDEIRQGMPIEAVLNHYGFKPLSVPKEGEPWRVYERDVDGQPQRIVVGTLKETRQQHFYEIGNRAFQGDVLELVRGLERPLLKPNETVEQRTFRMVDGWLSQPQWHVPAEAPTALRPVSQAYFLGTGSALQERAITEQHGLQPLIQTGGMDALSITKATLFTPEFAGRINNVRSTDPQIGQGQIGIAFPLVDQAGKLIDVATAKPEQAGTFVQQHNVPDTLWHSNRFYKTKTNIAVIGEKPIPAGTVGVGHRTDVNQFVFQYEQEGRERVVKLPVQEARAVVSEQSATRIVVGQSPVDVLAVKQLNPETEGERRLYVATIGSPTNEQITRIEQLLHKNPQAQLVIATTRDSEGYAAAINQIGINHPAANPAVRLSVAIEPIQSSGTSKASERDVGTFFYPNEPHLRSSDDLLKRFGYHANGQLSTEANLSTGIESKHIERLLSGKEGILSGTDQASTYSDKLALTALTSALVYADLHRVPLTDQLKVIRDTPMMQLSLSEAKTAMRQAYEREYSNKNQLTLELRQPGNQPVAQRINDQFLNRFVSTLSLIANQKPGSPQSQRTLDQAIQPDRPVQELYRQTFIDSKNGQVVTRSTITLPNEVRVLGKAAELLVNEANGRQGQRLVQLVQPTPQHKTIGEMLSARNGHPLPPSHRSSLGQPESIKPQTECITSLEVNTCTTRNEHTLINRELSSSTERQRTMVKVG